METLPVDDNYEVYNEKFSFWDFKGKFDFVDDWFLMSTPYPLMVITVAYLLFVLKLGPEYLKHRKPYQLKTVLLIYNAAQVAVSAWMVALSSEEARNVGLIQRTCLTDTAESRNKLATLTYYYFACKITELLDTIFFVLRKKQNQVTFLHVYHHTMMVWNGWIFLKYEPGYWMLFLGLMNCFVHVIMYTYYGLSAFPSLHKYLWWKKYITSLQLLQFGLILVQVTVSLFVNECKPSRTTVIYLYFNLLLFIYLFSSFYKNAYTVTNNALAFGTNNNKNILNKNKSFDNLSKVKNGNTNGGYFAKQESKVMLNARNKMKRN